MEDGFIIRVLATIGTVLLLSGLTASPKPVIAQTMATAPYPCHMGPRMLHVGPTGHPIMPHAATRAAIPALGAPAPIRSMQAARTQCVNAVAVINADKTPAAPWSNNCWYFSASLSLSENGPSFWRDHTPYSCVFTFTNGLPVGVPLYYRLTYGNPPVNVCLHGEAASGLRGSFTIPESALAARTPYFIPTLKVGC